MFSYYGIVLITCFDAFFSAYAASIVEDVITTALSEVKMAANEVIYRNVDRTYDMVSLAMYELTTQERLTTTHSQECTVNGIRSNDEEDVYKFRSAEEFGRIEENVMGTVMLRAVGISVLIGTN